jgi:hypothetical protein
MSSTPNFSSTKPTTAASPDPYEIIPSKWGNLPRWHVNANLTGEMKDYERVRNDAINAQSRLDDLAAREKALMADKMAFAAEKAAFKADAEAFGAGASALMGRIAVEQDRLEKIKADQEREQQEPFLPPGEQSELPAPALELEGDAIPGTDPGEPSETELSEDDVQQDPRGEFLRIKSPVPPPVLDISLMDTLQPRTPVGAGLDSKQSETNNGNHGD